MQGAANPLVKGNLSRTHAHTHKIVQFLQFRCIIFGGGVLTYLHLIFHFVFSSSLLSSGSLSTWQQECMDRQVSHMLLRRFYTKQTTFPLSFLTFELAHAGFGARIEHDPVQEFYVLLLAPFQQHRPGPKHSTNTKSSKPSQANSARVRYMTSWLALGRIEGGTPRR
jgi:hypothetical protein